MTKNRIAAIAGCVGVAILLVLAAAACSSSSSDKTTTAAATTGGAASSTAPANSAATGSSTASGGDAAAKLDSISGDTTGVTDDQIVIGTFFAQTGPAAVYDPILEAENAYFDNVNKNGGINGRKIKYIICDDGYNPTKTINCVNKLLQQDQVFMLYGTLGTPTTDAAQPLLKSAGVPDYFIASGDATWGTSGANFIGLQPDYVTEGTVMGKYAATTYPGKKIGIVYQNDDFGKEGDKGIKQGLGSSSSEIVGEETYEANAADWNAQATKLISKGAEVMLIFSTPTQYAAALKYEKAQGKTVTWIASSVAASSQTAKLAQGAMDGTITTGYLPDPSDPGAAAQKVDKWLKDHGIANPSAFSFYGYTSAQMLEQLLKSTGKNLNRSSIAYALQNVAFTGDFKPDLMEFSPKINNNNMYPIRYMFMQKWDESKGAFEKVGETINLAGNS
ncbi:ABC transporter substrate-binding protein [bacterium]|nr:ABC transporter substrate-binding protein [bacterium]